MSSPVTLSGFNNIDFGSIVTALMKQASAPLDALQQRQSDINAQLKSMTSLGNKINAVKGAADDLADVDGFTPFAATTTDSAAITASTQNGAMAGHYEVKVLELARAQVTASSTTAADANATAVASGGSMTIGGKTVSISSNTTLNGLASAINHTTGIGVTASVVRSGANAYRLVLTSNTTGEDGAFTVANNLTGGAGAVSFTDTDNDGVAGDDALDNAVQATNARALVNNVEAQSSTNEFSEAIPGVKFHVFKKDAVNPVGLDVTSDATSLKTKITAFMTSYNDVTKFLSDQNSAAGTGDTTSIGHAPLARQLRNDIRAALLKSVGTGTIRNLAQAGLEFTATGQMKLNDKVFSAAVTDHAEELAALFTGANGVFKPLSASMKAYSGTGGFLSKTRDHMNDQVKSLDKQIATMQTRLAAQKLSLQQEFAATDSLMTSLKSQSSSLSGIGN